MKSIKTLLAVALVAAATVTFVGCKEKSVTDSAGDKMENAKDSMKDAADKTADAAKEAGSATKEVVTNAVEKATH